MPTASAVKKRRFRVPDNRRELKVRIVLEADTPIDVSIENPPRKGRAIGLHLWLLPEADIAPRL